MTSQPPRMIGFQYRKKDGTMEMYTVEPYEIRSDEGVFFGYKVNDKKPGIRKFFLNSMRNELVLAQVFSPRWELKPELDEDYDDEEEDEDEG